MKTMTMSVIAVLLVAGGLLAQGPEDIRTVGADLLGAVSGDPEKFERGMRTLESLLAKNPTDPRLKVLYGTGVFARSGAAFQKGDVANAMKLWQASLDEMAQAVAMAPDNIFVRARRGVVLISASRATPPVMARPLTQLAVDDFEKVLEIREKEQTLSLQSAHKRGELLTGLADGWNRLGDQDKARGYFERITRDLSEGNHLRAESDGMAGRQARGKSPGVLRLFRLPSGITQDRGRSCISSDCAPTGNRPSASPWALP